MPMHLLRETVWCNFWSEGIIGLYFLDSEDKVHFHLGAIRKMAIFEAQIWALTHAPITSDRLVQLVER